MLILTRYTGQTLQIGDDIKIRILGVRKGRISLGIEAPDEIEVHREEIYQKIKDRRKRYQEAR